MSAKSMVYYVGQNKVTVYPVTEKEVIFNVEDNLLCIENAGSEVTLVTSRDGNVISGLKPGEKGLFDLHAMYPCYEMGCWRGKRRVENLIAFLMVEENQ